MKVGDYVRTKDGIIGTLYGNYAYDENQLAILTKSNENGVEYTQEYSKDEIINSSPNIIDLIEVGDYVNGSYVEGFIEKNKFQNKLIITEAGMIDNNDIKSIVTREMFESMEYKVKE